MQPQRIALLTDSCADLSPQMAQENHIFVVPLRILCADGEYADGVDITNADIYRRLRAGELPQTSLPAGEEIEKVLRQIVAEGYDGVIAVMLSGGLSGTYNLVRLVAEELQSGTLVAVPVREDGSRHGWVCRRGWICRRKFSLVLHKNKLITPAISAMLAIIRDFFQEDVTGLLPGGGEENPT